MKVPALGARHLSMGKISSKCLCTSINKLSSILLYRLLILDKAHIYIYVTQPHSSCMSHQMF